METQECVEDPTHPGIRGSFAWARHNSGAEVERLDKRFLCDCARDFGHVAVSEAIPVLVASE